MFDRMVRSFELAKSSWQVLKADKELVLFPILSGVGCILILITFALPFLAQPDLLSFLSEDENQSVPFWAYVVVFLYYFCNYFIVVFFNAALVSCAIIRFNGGNPTLADGIRTSFDRIPQIAAWAAVSATIGLLLKAVENSNEKAGRFISSLLGTAWTVMTYFVVPVLVVEKIGPIEAVKRSMSILKKTWGEALIGHWGLGFFSFLLMLPGIVLLVAGCFLLQVSVALGITVVVLAVLALLVAGAAGAALNGIYISDMYQYASTGQVPQGFAEATIRGAFVPQS
ncbi:MAG: hypothetical protein KatS3mg105_1976 [Gemmatales bacterium]|nr:MAG: hypothetical protein KatS3mg105_1976 [Gemmatales bacterium]